MSGHSLLSRVIAARRYWQGRLTVNDDADTSEYPALLKRSEVADLVKLLQSIEEDLKDNG